MSLKVRTWMAGRGGGLQTSLRLHSSLLDFLSTLKSNPTCFYHAPFLYPFLHSDHQNSRDDDGNRNENNTTMSITTSTDWCRVDTGYYTIAMVNGSKQDAYLSYRRDGSVWIRVGQDSTEDWKFREETRAKFKVTLLSQELMNFIEQLNYTDQCVLSDLNFNIRINSGLRQFHLDVYLPRLFILFTRRTHVFMCTRKHRIIYAEYMIAIKRFEPLSHLAGQHATTYVVYPFTSLERMDGSVGREVSYPDEPVKTTGFEPGS
ncbi:hypothetical protein HELRODRAFT_182793 [Helobdella robusta]|uniref:Uncharacterized protein n=1 Tax=Helobdella robusta TaxID=6412 RepID=T1FIR1_HELRO|nr:hypothetical protein HELRODRAFT_182793 [Helobdella robusta]ESN90099.1 hypothetical protein HELRODRAFT_182793 [Helobdella robusta]